MPPHALTLLGLYIICVIALLIAELKGWKRGQYIFKPLAGIGFCLIALSIGAAGTRYGQLVLAALFLSLLGDIFLLYRDQPQKFKLGIGAFAGAHIIYSLAFFIIIPTRGINHSDILPLPQFLLWGPEANVVTFFLLALTLAFIPQYLYRHLPKDMRGPVGVYIGLIITMLILAVLARHPFVGIAALMFAISDLAVARDRFIKPDPRHALIITPFYFGAQALFAISTAF